jgi:hypothetical protein
MDEIWTFYNSIVNGLGEIKIVLWHERDLKVNKDLINLVMSLKSDEDD